MRLHEWRLLAKRHKFRLESLPSIKKGTSFDPQPCCHPLEAVAPGLSCTWSIDSKCDLTETKNFPATARGRANIQRAVALPQSRPIHFASSSSSFLSFRCYKAIKERSIQQVSEHWTEPAEKWKGIIKFFFFSSLPPTLISLCFCASLSCASRISCGQMLLSLLPHNLDLTVFQFPAAGPFISAAEIVAHPLCQSCHGDRADYLKFGCFNVYAQTLQLTLITCWTQVALQSISGKNLSGCSRAQINASPRIMLGCSPLDHRHDVFS